MDSTSSTLLGAATTMALLVVIALQSWIAPWLVALNVATVEFSALRMKREEDAQSSAHQGDILLRMNMEARQNRFDSKNRVDTRVAILDSADKELQDLMLQRKATQKIIYKHARTIDQLSVEAQTLRRFRDNALMAKEDTNVVDNTSSDVVVAQSPSAGAQLKPSPSDAVFFGDNHVSLMVGENVSPALGKGVTANAWSFKTFFSWVSLSRSNSYSSNSSLSTASASASSSSSSPRPSKRKSNHSAKRKKRKAKKARKARRR